MNKPTKIRLQVISPIHIGCDDVYEPTNFRIDENKKLVSFDAMDFIKAMTNDDRQKFLALCSQGTIRSLLGIYKFIAEKKNNGKEIDTAQGLLSHYKSVLKMSENDEHKIKQELNNFQISRTAYNASDKLPYIPGSTVKGAMRTAWLTKLAKEYGVSNYKESAKKLEQFLLKGSFATDPFRMVKVSDFMPVGNAKTKVFYAVNKKKKKSKFDARGPFQILETIERGSSFEGIINLDYPLREANISKHVELNELKSAIQETYRNLLSLDIKTMQELGVGNDTIGFYKSFIENGKILLRIGRHSGAESVTIEGNRNIKIMGKRGEQPTYKNHSTTTWFASEYNKASSNDGLLPFGWAVLEFLPYDEKEAIYPVREPITKAPAITSVPTPTEPLKPVKKEAKHETWQNADLTWIPGSQTLKAEKDGKKAELKLGQDKYIIPETLRHKLIDKKKPVKAHVTVEVDGNAYKIIKVE